IHAASIVCGIAVVIGFTALGIDDVEFWNHRRSAEPRGTSHVLSLRIQRPLQLLFGEGHRRHEEEERRQPEAETEELSRPPLRELGNERDEKKKEEKERSRRVRLFPDKDE